MAAIAEQKAQFQQTTANVAPYLTAGTSSLQDLVTGTQPGGGLNQQAYTPFTTAQFQQDPGYQFQLQQGQNALTNQESVTGGPNSNNMKSLVGYTQGLANTDYQTALGNYIQQFQVGNQATQQQYTNVSNQAAQGLSAGLQQGQIGIDTAQSVGSNLVGAGNVLAAGTVGSANAITGAASTGYNQYLQQQYLAQNNNASGVDPNTGLPYGAAGSSGAPNSSTWYVDPNATS
jgi:hypothetical protein